MQRAEAEAYRSRVRGSLLGGAIGDALGAPIALLDTSTIRAFHGSVQRFLEHPDGAPAGTVSSSTQMILYTVDGLIRAGIRRDRGLGLTVAVVHSAYDRWLDTQLRPGPPATAGWLDSQQWLYARRAPGRTCLDALTSARAGAARIKQYGGRTSNDSKGCGGAVRAAPFGLMPPDEAPENWYFDSAATAAGYTHGHPTGQRAAGATAMIVHRLVAGDQLDEALDATVNMLAYYNDIDVSTALQRARLLARNSPPSTQTLESLGRAWIAEEALAIAVYAALTSPAPEQFLNALETAVSHSGASDATGAICGNLLGAWHGETALPPELVFGVEGRGTILELADDLALEFTTSERLHGEYLPETGWRERYS